ncbi:MAG: sensor histidine kinase [Luteitalea sp.]|nr:sensor histidine kinase [Luteitalea sp.]
MSPEAAFTSTARGDRPRVSFRTGEAQYIDERKGVDHRRGCSHDATILEVVIRRSGRRSSPTTGLLIGLVITLAAVVADAWYMTRQISGLQALQTDLAERNRQDSLQLLRIQNDLNLLALAMRDMLDSDEPYPLTAWSAQLERIRVDLDDALRREAEVAVASRTPEQRQYLGDSLAQFWSAMDRMFALARDGREDEARAQIRLSLQARQAGISTMVARLLVENNEAEEDTARRVQAIYDQVQRQVYRFVTATLTTILLTSLYVIHSNRKIFAELATLSEDRRELAQQLIATREATLREISRELHDELGQVLTAIGSMVGRAGRQLPVGSPLQADLLEIREIAQVTLDKVRGLSQTLHPSALEEAGLEATIDWYLSTVKRQTGVAVSYERSGAPRPVDTAVGIHVYRVLQESLSNVARHAGVDRAWVRLRFAPARLELEIEDHGKGIDVESPRRGLGIVGMRERASLLGGAIAFSRPDEGGTLVRLTLPLDDGAVKDDEGQHSAPAPVKHAG